MVDREHHFERAKRIIVEQGSGLSPEQVEAQRDLWIINASQWEDEATRFKRALAEIAKPVFVAEPAGTPESPWYVALDERIKLAVAALASREHEDSTRG